MTDRESHAFAMLREGVHPRSIEVAGLQAGMPMPPLALQDEVSLSLSMHVAEQTRKDLAAEGRTLPARWYSDPAVWELERERIFARTWQFVGPVQWVAEHGDHFSAMAAHIPVVVVRDGDEIRAFVNVCRHRAHLVVQGRGNRASLQCPYHAWTFGLDGCLRSAPRLREEDMRASAEELGLRPLRCEVFGLGVFVNADLDAAPLTEALGDVPEQLARSGVDFASLQLRRSVDWTSTGNWKNAVENYLECYHCPVAHPGFSQAIDVRPEHYVLETGPLTMSQRGPARHDGAEALLPRGVVEVSQYHLLFPTTSIDVVPGPPNLTLYTWNPTGPHSMAATAHYFFAPEVTEAEVDQILEFAAGQPMHGEISAEEWAILA